MSFARFAVFPAIVLGAFVGSPTFDLHWLVDQRNTSIQAPPITLASNNANFVGPVLTEPDADSAKGTPLPDIRIEPTVLTFDCSGKTAGLATTSVSIFTVTASKSSAPSAPISVQVDPLALREAALRKSLVLNDVPLFDGSSESFAVEQFSVFSPDAKLVGTDGVTEVPLARPDMFFFDGRSLDDPEKHIFLSVVDGQEVWMMVSSPFGTTALAPDSSTAKFNGEHTLVRVEDFGGSGFECFADALPENAEKMLSFTEPTVKAGPKSTELLEAEILVDVGNDLYKNRFGSSSATATTYTGNLFGTVSAIYRRDLNVNLRIKQLVVWTSADPFAGANSDVQLTKYETYNRQNRANVQRDLCHLLANVESAGGIAYLDVLCNEHNFGDEFDFAVSNIFTGFELPPTGYAWDVDVVAHETGHNFGSPHTHCYNPPIDCCFTECASLCPSQVPQVGTIMSYCHLTAFGSSLVFNGRVATLMRQNAEDASCITPLLSGNEFIIYNDGNAALQVTSMAPTATASWLTLAPAAPFTVYTGAIQPIEVNVNCNTVPSNGATAFVRVQSNDPNESPYPGDVIISVIGDCPFLVSPVSNSLGVGGGTGTFSIDTDPTCNWTLQSDQSWARVTSATNGTGDATVNYTVDPNPTTSIRTAKIVVAGSDQVHTITQAGVPCTYAIAATSTTSFPSTGGTGTIGVTSLDGCPWTAQADKTWIEFPLGASGIGSGTLTYDVQANPTTSSRTAKITVPGAPGEIMVTQNGITCNYIFGASSVSVPGSGGNLSVSVIAPSPCFWTVSSDQAWLQITANGSGTGTKTLQYTVLPNETLTPRTGTLSINGTEEEFTVVQGSAVCSYDFAPDSANFVASGGVGSVSLDTAAPCPWSAVSDQPWLVVTSSQPNTGDATINFTVLASTSALPRVGHITVGDAQFTVNQAAVACNFRFFPSAANYAFGGGAGTVDVQALGVCNWTAVSSAPWVVITAGADGTGNGTFSYTVAPNPSIASRTATITIEGANFSHTIGQGGSNCFEGVKSPDGGETWQLGKKRKVS